MDRRWRLVMSALIAVAHAAAVATVASAQPYGAKPPQGHHGEREDRSGEQDGSMDNELDGRRRDAPSEDGTLAPPADDRPPGCLFQERSLELIV